MRKLLLTAALALVVLGSSWMPTADARPWRGRARGYYYYPGYYSSYYYAPAYGSYYNYPYYYR